ncbi:MAG: hypothetical protein OXG85_15615 [Chloroflexi bacterium]|nr:hypothetical protein [Chloroflexota bacterium]
MSERPRDIAWRLLVALVQDILNPLLLISLALFCGAGYILTLSAPVDIDAWVALLCCSLLLPIIPLLLRARHRWRQTSATTGGWTWPCFLPILPILILLPIFGVELSSPILQILHHGDIHVAYIHQLMYSVAPPQNIFLPGYPANSYWLYHAVLAAIVQATSLSPPYVASVLSIVAIVSSLLWIAQTLIAFKIAAPSTLCLGLLTLVVYCSMNLHGPLAVTAEIIEGADTPIHVRQMLLAGGSNSPPLHSTLGKVMNFTSMPLAILAFCASLYVGARISQNGMSRFGVIIFTASVTVGLAVQPIAALYILAALFGGLALTLLAFSQGFTGEFTTLLLHWRRQPTARKCAYVLLLIGCASLAAPLLHYVVNFATSHAAGPGIDLLSVNNSLMIFSSIILFLPLFVVQNLFLVGEKRRDHCFIQLAFFLGFLLTAILDLPDKNQYKGVFFLAILVATSGLLVLRRMQNASLMRWRAIARLLMIGMLALLLLKIIIVTRHYDGLAEDNAFQYSGVHINYFDVPLWIGLRDALYWIRVNAEHDSAVILPLSSHKYTHMIHERTTYVRKTQVWYTSGIPAYNKRVANVAMFYDPGVQAEQYEQLLQDMVRALPGRPLYAVVRESYVDAETMARRGARRVFQHSGGGAHVYLLNPASLE